MVEQEGQRYDHRHQGNIEYEGEVDIQERVDKQYVQALAVVLRGAVGVHCRVFAEAAGHVGVFPAVYR